MIKLFNFFQTFYKKNNERNSSAKLEKLERDGSVYKRGRGRGRGVSRSRPIHKEPGKKKKKEKKRNILLFYFKV